MDQKSYQLGGICLLSIGVVVGCASANTTLDDVNSDAVVQMVVLNRTPHAVTAFVEWQGGARIRLGELPSGDTRTFTTPYRGTDFRLSLDVARPSPSSRASPPSPGRSDTRPPFVPVYPGDRYEWQIRLVIPSVDIFYRRLSPR